MRTSGVKENQSVVIRCYQKKFFRKQMRTSLFQILDNEDFYLDVKNISSNLSKTAQLKQVDPINLVSNLLLYFIGTTIDVFTRYASL